MVGPAVEKLDKRGGRRELAQGVPNAGCRGVNRKFAFFGGAVQIIEVSRSLASQSNWEDGGILSDDRLAVFQSQDIVWGRYQSCQGGISALPVEPF